MNDRTGAKRLFRRGVFLPLLAAIDPAAAATEPSRSDSAGVRFVEVSADAGIDFVHVNGASGQKYFPETMGGGVAFLDYDGDGSLDVYLVNGAPLPGYRAASGNGQRSLPQPGERDVREDQRGSGGR